MSAKDYKVTYPYGATTPPYSPSRPHRGNDRPTPMATPIVIGSTTIGLTGNSGSYMGMTYDPHLHTQAGTDQACQNTFNPSAIEFKGGTVVATGYGSQWGNYITIKVATDKYITYAHLSKINVIVGQVIKETTVASFTKAQVNKVYKVRRGSSKGATPAEQTLHATKGTIDSLLDPMIVEADKSYKAIAAKDKVQDGTIATQKATIDKLLAQIQTGAVKLVDVEKKLVSMQTLVTEYEAATSKFEQEKAAIQAEYEKKIAEMQEATAVTEESAVRRFIDRLLNLVFRKD